MHDTFRNLDVDNEGNAAILWPGKDTRQSERDESGDSANKESSSGMALHLRSQQLSYPFVPSAAGSGVSSNTRRGALGKDVSAMVSLLVTFT